MSRYGSKKVFAMISNVVSKGALYYYSNYRSTPIYASAEPYAILPLPGTSFAAPYAASSLGAVISDAEKIWNQVNFLQNAAQNFQTAAKDNAATGTAEIVQLTEKFTQQYNSTVQSLTEQSRLRQNLQAVAETAAPELAQRGIRLDESGQLKLDSTQLQSALEKDRSATLTALSGEKGLISGSQKVSEAVTENGLSGLLAKDAAIQQNTAADEQEQTAANDEEEYQTMLKQGLAWLQTNPIGNFLNILA